MTTMYLIIWTDKNGEAHRFETEYSTDATDFDADCKEEGLETETFRKEPNDCHFTPINF